MKIGQTAYIESAQINFKTLQTIERNFCECTFIYLDYTIYAKMDVHFWYDEKHVNNKILDEYRYELCFK